jgi:hypothetical protein
VADVPMYKMDLDDFMAEVRRRAGDDSLRVPNFAVRRLLAVVGKVLEAHRNADGRCAWCRNQDGQRQKFPCGEYLAITRELTGKGKDDA